MQPLPTNTKHLPVDARLAEAVRDVHGQLLLPPGASLTFDILRSLRNRGIDVVRIDAPPGGAPSNPPIQKDPVERRLQVEDRLQYLFRPAICAGQINPLYHLVLEYRLRDENYGTQPSHS